jgi:Acetyltransferases
MEYTRIENTKHPLFTKAWSLYVKSFPSEERRIIRTQKKIMNNPLYHFEIITDDGKFVGFIMWWDFEKRRYLEHFATLPRLRGKGHGKHIIETFISRANSPILLEVEHPDTEINKRRIDFYQRIGFVLNEYKYEQPPHTKHGDYVPLMLMTYPDAVSQEDVKLFCQQYCEHASIYHYMPVTD